MESGPVLNEPIMKVEIIVPEAHMGDVLGDLNTRQARVQGMNTEKGRSIVSAHVPLAEMLHYTTQIRSMTGGRGFFTMDFDHYEVVPSFLTQEIIAAHQKEKKEE
jgi:elongation factor G